jgi:hypothetical protein
VVFGTVHFDRRMLHQDERYLKGIGEFAGVAELPD